MKRALPLVLLVALSACTVEPAQPAPSVTGPAPVTHAQNDRVPEGAAWSEHYFPSGDDVELHADVLLPENLSPGQKVAPILVVGPYVGHSGQLGDEGFKKTGPSARFDHLVEGGRLFERGYALVLVDSRGFGGSTGCHDLLGPGEQADVRAAIDWAASRPWSSGSVGMFGRSYDGTTALIGNNLNQDALKAVVAVEPIWQPYRNFYSGGIERATVGEISQQYIKTATAAQMPDDTKKYRANALWEKQNPQCVKSIRKAYRHADPDAAFWADRDFLAPSVGSDTPLFVHQGFLDSTTEPESIEQYLANHEGPERGWLGPWNHIRGDLKLDSGLLAGGKEGWMDEVMAFYDEHLKGIAPATAYPAFSVQDSTGSWRALDSWPPAADQTRTLRLRGGSYTDDAMESGREGEGTSTLIRRSEPLEQATRITGTPRLALRAQGKGNIMVRLYDVAPDGQAVLFDDQACEVRSGEMVLELGAADWTLAEGHALVVEIGTIEPGGMWQAEPSYRTVRVSEPRLTLALDDPADDVADQGYASAFLGEYIGTHTYELRDLGPASFGLLG